jgi:ABC-type transport system involved in multi-copper enzyme maturation permease subunit
VTQTIAIFVDAYRQLNARKLFWITLILSGLVVAAFAMVGVTEKGLKVLAWEIDIPILMTPKAFYKTMFVSFGINFWLAWLASILALISTASIFPDLVASGAIEPVLSKPISRLRVFLTTYVAGLLFTALQVSVFSAAAFLVLGLRGDTWEPAIFLAVPLVVVFFSYLFSVCALLGLVTRSTITALLLTMLAWFLIFAVHGTESGLLGFRLSTERMVEKDRAWIAVNREELERRESSTEEADRNRAERLKDQLATRTTKVAEKQRTLDRVTSIHRIFYGIKTVLPKTSETVGLLQRWLISLAELPAPMEGQGSPPFSEDDAMANMNDPEFQKELERTVRSRSVGWIMGTSLLFEALMLAAGAFIFCRSDY